MVLGLTHIVALFGMQARGALRPRCPPPSFLNVTVQIPPPSMDTALSISMQRQGRACPGPSGTLLHLPALDLFGPAVLGSFPLYQTTTLPYALSLPELLEVGN